MSKEEPVRLENYKKVETTNIDFKVNLDNMKMKINLICSFPIERKLENTDCTGTSFMEDHFSTG